MKVIESFNKPWRACIPMIEVKHNFFSVKHCIDCAFASKVVANQDLKKLLSSHLGQVDSPFGQVPFDSHSLNGLGKPSAS